jgi:prepilin peptidase CpaA
MMASMAFSLIFTGLLLAACISDLRSFRIPNALSLALIALFILRVLTLADVALLPSHLMAFGLTVGLGFLVFAMGAIGGGDVKLIAVLALWFGMEHLSSFIVTTALAGGVLALFLIAVRSSMAGATAPSTNAPMLLRRNAPVPYALPIAFAALWLEWG